MKKYLTFLPLLAILLAACPVNLVADDDVILGTDDGTGIINFVTLAWNKNPEPDIAGYNVYYGRVSGEYVRFVTVSVPKAIVKVRGNTTFYFAATAFNIYGEESDFSNEVQWP